MEPGWQAAETAENAWTGPGSNAVQVVDWHVRLAGEAVAELEGAGAEVAEGPGAAVVEEGAALVEERDAVLITEVGVALVAVEGAALVAVEGVALVAVEGVVPMAVVGVGPVAEGVAVTVVAAARGVGQLAVWAEQHLLILEQLLKA